MFPLSLCSHRCSHHLLHSHADCLKPVHLSLVQVFFKGLGFERVVVWERVHFRNPFHLLVHGLSTLRGFGWEFWNGHGWWNLARIRRLRLDSVHYDVGCLQHLSYNMFNPYELEEGGWTTVHHSVGVTNVLSWLRGVLALLKVLTNSLVISLDFSTPLCKDVSQHKVLACTCVILPLFQKQKLHLDINCITKKELHLVNFSQTSPNERECCQKQCKRCCWWTTKSSNSLHLFNN